MNHILDRNSTWEDSKFRWADGSCSCWRRRKWWCWRTDRMKFKSKLHLNRLKIC